MPAKKSNSRQFSVASVLFITLLFLMAALLVYFPHYARLKKMRQANAKLTSKIKHLEGEIAALKDQIHKAKTDSSLYERIARDELGVIKEGEIAVDIKP